MKRRNFLRTAGTAAIMASVGTRLRIVAQTIAAHPPQKGAFAGGSRAPILVIVRLFGGNDGLNTVVPYTDDNYYRMRGRDSGHDIAIQPGQVVKLPNNHTLGLNPALSPLLPLYKEGKLAIVQNVGYAQQDLSHFRSSDIWLSATDPDVYDLSGWAGRYLESVYPEYQSKVPSAPYAIELGTTLSRTLMGHRYTLGYSLADTSYILPPVNPAGSATGKSGLEEEYIRENIRQNNLFLHSILDTQQRQPSNRVAYPETRLATDLAMVARLIAGGLSTQIYMVTTFGYDFHIQLKSEQHKTLSELGGAMAAFQRDLEALGVQKYVSLMTISEFGRRVIPTGSGTDHGGGSMMLVMGHGVNGGIIGLDPNLSDLEGPGNLKWQYDFRQVYASVLGQWMQASPANLNASLFRQFTQIPLFKREFNPPEPLASFDTLSLGSPIPNPASSIAVFRLSGSMIESGTFMLHNSIGRHVLRIQVPAYSQSIPVNISSLPPGAYIGTLITGKQRMNTTLTVVH